MTVGQIRNACQGLADEARVVIWQHYTDDSEGGAMVVLEDVHPDGGTLALVLEVTAFEDDLMGDDKEDD